MLTFFVFFVIIGRFLRTAFLFIRSLAKNFSLDGLVSLFVFNVVGVKLEDVYDMRQRRMVVGNSKRAY